MFGSQDKSIEKQEGRRNITRKLSYVGVALISIMNIAYISNYINYRVNGTLNKPLTLWTGIIIPGCMALLCIILMMIALAWICRSLKNEPQVMGNEKWMAV